MSEALAPDRIRAEQPVSIRAEASLVDPDSCKFTVSCSVHPGGSFFFADRERAAGSPLGERLFALGGVASVLIAGNVVTTGKAPDASWTGLKAAIGSVIRAQLLSGMPAILETVAPGGTLARSDAELGAAVQELLDREVNRSIASHGGKISLVEVQGGRLFITMSGGCQGCASSQVTLREGFEVMVKRVAPEITAIVDATDHAAGKQPFYPRAGSMPG
ncbi:MAG: NifU family protein [Hydrogenophaga sp.]|uniref:NifU family protein n=1 Tax=Hydrogenophaga sp. TaxID=1904254 RepID=UPI0026341A9E|nr:NifU family protein [Hydrogenophaga sp.]MDM7943492.1 NifU family protein [Hydrogenophaga sp.]